MHCVSPAKIFLTHPNHFQRNVILVPENGSIALPCTILADLINQAGLNCTVYQATPTQWVELVSVEGVEWIMCGTLSQSLQLRNTAKNLKLGTPIAPSIFPD